MDGLKKDRDKKIEGFSPETAVVKETARRFKENTGSRQPGYRPGPRSFGKKKDYIRIEDGKSIFKIPGQPPAVPLTWNMVHYDVQLIGGMVLHSGKISKWQTGEGQTLVSTLPAYLNALAGEGVHIVTVNDYLARRDQEWNGL